ncbi:hypothetical protein W03_06400 [Nitrosomonas sp. PY1]|nr:hypothetical protein W03_06400 [Nitrosomonas sp. PY1]
MSRKIIPNLSDINLILGELLTIHDEMTQRINEEDTLLMGTIMFVDTVV